MSLEEQVRLHGEWLRSIDSNLDRAAASLAASYQRHDAIDKQLEATNEALAVVAQNQSSFAAAQASQARRMDQLTERVDKMAVQQADIAAEHKELAALHKELAAQHLRLEQAFEQYMRSRSNGRQN